MARITNAQKDAFFERLGETGQVKDACRHAGFGTEAVYRLRKSDEGFARRLAEALERGALMLDLELLRRALEGWCEPVFYKGVQCGEIRRYDNRLGMELLKAHRPETYGERRSAAPDGEATVRELLEEVDGMSRAGPEVGSQWLGGAAAPY